ncbi:hypothetical protein NLU13_0352 [Sarocladium strictum]|uniref:Uncharacterized protein n=1 Tax=Sarocladium strictum TaxID=5046 RepID=A0AA39GQS8_SARSR|nr:hypothetical protein NLU13_0352 [Sarocladium strictum]
MAAATILAPRYSAEDFETTSIHSAAPSYISEVPSYHSTAPHHEPIPPYSPPTRASTRMNNHSGDESQIQYGLPPIPDTPIHGAANLYNFRVPTWSTHNAPAARQYRSVIERRAAARSTGAGRHHRWASLENGGPSSSSATLPAAPSSTGLDADPGSGTRTPRPLEDPYLVGEEAAAEARRERLRRENGDDILIREDQHWDWLLAQMESWESRERSWQKYHREVVERTQRRSILRSVRGRLRG